MRFSKLPTFIGYVSLFMSLSAPALAGGIPVKDIEERTAADSWIRAVTGVRNDADSTKKFTHGTNVILHCANNDPTKGPRNFRIANDGSWFESEDLSLRQVVDDALWLYQSDEHEVLKITNLVQFRPADGTLKYSIHGKDGSITMNEYSCIAYQNPFRA